MKNIEVMQQNILSSLGRKQKETDLQLKILGATNVEFLVTICEFKDNSSTSIHISNTPKFNQIQFDATKIKTYVNQIEEVLDLKPAKAVLKFANSSLNKESDTNVRLNIINNTSKIIWGHRSQSEIVLYYEDDFTISFKDDIFNLFNTEYLLDKIITEQSTIRNKYPLKKPFYYFADLFQSANYSYGNYSIIGLGSDETIFDIIKNW